MVTNTHPYFISLTDNRVEYTQYRQENELLHLGRQLLFWYSVWLGRKSLYCWRKEQLQLHIQGKMGPHLFRTLLCSSYPSFPLPPQQQAGEKLPIMRLDGHSKPVQTVDWHPSSNTCLTGSLDHTVRVVSLTWRRESGRLASLLWSLMYKEAVNCLQLHFSPRVPFSELFSLLFLKLPKNKVWSRQNSGSVLVHLRTMEELYDEFFGLYVFRIAIHKKNSN